MSSKFNKKLGRFYQKIQTGKQQLFVHWDTNAVMVHLLLLMCSKQNIYVELFLVSSIEQSIELNMIGLWLSTLGTLQRLPTGSSSIVGRILKLKKIDRICSKRHKSH